MNTCENCGRSFECKINSPPCWCESLPLAKDLPKEFKNCLCETCLTSFTQNGLAFNVNEPMSNRDFYINEKGLYVFTRFYLSSRGHCCNSGCTNCPY